MNSRVQTLLYLSILTVFLQPHLLYASHSNRGSGHYLAPVSTIDSTHNEMKSQLTEPLEEAKIKASYALSQLDKTLSNLQKNNLLENISFVELSAIINGLFSSINHAYEHKCLTGLNLLTINIKMFDFTLFSFINPNTNYLGIPSFIVKKLQQVFVPLNSTASLWDQWADQQKPLTIKAYSKAMNNPQSLIAPLTICDDCYKQHAVFMNHADPVLSQLSLFINYIEQAIIEPDQSWENVQPQIIENTIQNNQQIKEILSDVAWGLRYSLTHSSSRSMEEQKTLLALLKLINTSLKKYYNNIKKRCKNHPDETIIIAGSKQKIVLQLLSSLTKVFSFSNDSTPYEEFAQQQSKPVTFPILYHAARKHNSHDGLPQKSFFQALNNLLTTNSELQLTAVLHRNVPFITLRIDFTSLPGTLLKKAL